MSIRNERREAAVERMADHLLSEGLGAATLRPLAAAAGISDRMLLYYFADKDEILSVTLHRIAARMTAQLDEAVPIGRPRSFPVLLEEVWAALGSEDVKPFMHLWLDLASGAARGVQPHLKIAGTIADGFLAWVKSRLEIKQGVDHPLSAALFLASIEGMHLLEAIGRRSIADSAVAELSARSKPRR
ncbi:TetR family transcriptional regulator [Bradyrhizobium genosp. P]|uniref:TetR family transcriptional regulator n=1 Tax=Bradyrhizobium genosp. P TaxID=83641 RepID=UPI003CF574A9